MSRGSAPSSNCGYRLATRVPNGSGVLFLQRVLIKLMKEGEVNEDEEEREMERERERASESEREIE